MSVARDCFLSWPRCARSWYFLDCTVNQHFSDFHVHSLWQFLLKRGSDLGGLGWA